MDDQHIRPPILQTTDIRHVLLDCLARPMPTQITAAGYARARRNGPRHAGGALSTVRDTSQRDLVVNVLVERGVEVNPVVGVLAAVRGVQSCP